MTAKAVERTARRPVAKSQVIAPLADDLARRLRDIGETGGPSVKAAQAALEILDQTRREIGRGIRPWWEEESLILRCDEFLAPSELAALRSYVLARRDAFAPASLINRETSKSFIDRSFRLSETLFKLGPFRDLFETRILYYLDFVCARLTLPAFSRPTFELQITATRNGGFFRAHDDNSHYGNRTRRLTFVCYFFFEPLRWSGGALHFTPFDARSAPLDVLPVQNRAVFFNSALRHEVLPFVSESDSFQAARFTVNGWVHQDTWP